MLRTLPDLTLCVSSSDCPSVSLIISCNELGDIHKCFPKFWEQLLTEPEKEVVEPCDQKVLCVSRKGDLKGKKRHSREELGFSLHKMEKK